MKNIQYYFCFALLGLSLLTSCNPDRQDVEDRKLIEDFLDDNNLQAEKTASGLYYIIHSPGGTEHPLPSDNVNIAYAGRLLNGNEFDSSLSSTFRLGDLIDGMVEGIGLIGKGGEATFFIPSELGYGGTSRPGIPANSVTVFDVTLIDF